MKTTVVPAQVTTVEDRIAGNLSLNQLMLLISPVFLDSLLYIILPPYMHISDYKIVIFVLLLAICCLSAIRIKGKIVILWVLTIVKYNARPGYFVYNKNIVANREQYQSTVEQLEEKAESKEIKHHVHIPELGLPDRERLTELLENPAAKVSYELNKGGLRVRLTEIKD